MEMGRATQVVLRTAPLRNCFISSVNRATIRRSQPAIHSSQMPRRGISITAQPSQQAAARRPRDEADDAATPEQPPTQSPKPAARKSTNTDFLENPRRGTGESTSPRVQSRSPSDQINAAPRIPGTRLDFLRQPSRNRQSQSPSNSSPAPKTSIDELMHGMNRRDSTPYRPGDRQSFDLSRMQRPTGPLASRSNYSRSILKKYTENLEKSMTIPSFRLGPSLGRTVAVNETRGMDVARAFQTVNIKCAANSVRHHLRNQRFHERPGTKRKRLASERWRRRFKEDFRTTIRRVEDMRRKGW